jgi:hypothetical protein
LTRIFALLGFYVVFARQNCSIPLCVVDFAFRFL